jgi:hypothetical protein
MPVLNVDGMVVQGLGAASGFTIAAQMPCFEKEIPELKGSHHGTMNLRLDSALRIHNPDREIGCFWRAAQGEVWEVFGFLEITIEFPISGEPRRAWIYIPYDSPHRNNHFQIEIIWRKIHGLGYGSRCRINLPRGRAESGCIVV